MKKELSIKNVVEIAEQDAIRQEEEYERSLILNNLNDQLSEFKSLLKDNNFEMVCYWSDEYGGIQSVSEPFNLNIQEK